MEIVQQIDTVIHKKGKEKKHRLQKITFAKIFFNKPPFGSVLVK